MTVHCSLSASGGMAVKALHFIAPPPKKKKKLGDRQDRTEEKSKSHQDSMFAMLKQYKDSSESEKLLLTALTSNPVLHSSTQ